jgi:hypothetical protein
LLEENLRKMGGDAMVPPQPKQEEENDDENDERPQKKEFLKRKSQKAPLAVPTKKYNYYVDNFEETKKKEANIQPAKTTAAPQQTAAHEKPAVAKQEEKSTPISSHSNPFSKQQSVESNPTNRAVSPIDNGNRDQFNEGPDSKNKSATKKRFLTRGSGTAGGKQGHHNPKPLPQKGAAKDAKKRPANQLLSDDEYPNDFNFAAE